MTRRNCSLLAVGLLGLHAAPAFAAEGDLAIFPDARMFLLIGLFVLLIFPADKLLFRPLLATLDERARRIAGARERAHEVMHQADHVLAGYQRAVEAARDDADGHRKERLATARHELLRITREARGLAEDEVARARQQVQAGVAEARAVLRGESQRLGQEAAARVLGRQLA